MAGDDGMRAADRDREKAAEVLRVAYAEGRLDPEELNERTGSVLRARTWGELRHLIADIPAPGADAGVPGDDPGPAEPLTTGFRTPVARRLLPLGALVLATALACMLIDAAVRNVAVIALAVLLGSVAAARRG